MLHPDLFIPIPFIVAELSANHLGSLPRAMELIDACADAGAHAVKFQAYKAESLVIDQSYKISGGPWDGRLLIDLYREAETPFGWFPSLFQHAGSRGLIPMASVFDAGGLAMLEQLECPIYKIASFELVDLDLIHRVAGAGKPMILSTGMASFAEIDLAVKVCAENGSGKLILLHCVSGYPTPPENAYLDRMLQIKERAPLETYPFSVGISDHSIGTEASMLAVAMGAEVVEKHVTLSRADGGPDAAFSIEPSELSGLVRDCERARLMVKGNGLQNAERSSLPLRRSLWSSAPISAGEKFTQDNVGSYRPGLGMQPIMLKWLLGRFAKHDINAATPLKTDMVGPP